MTWPSSGSSWELIRLGQGSTANDMTAIHKHLTPAGRQQGGGGGIERKARNREGQAGEVMEQARDTGRGKEQDMGKVSQGYGDGKTGRLRQG